MPDVERTILDIIARKANVEPRALSRATELSTLTLDSLDKIEIIFQIEESFDISLPFNANQSALPVGLGLTTAGDVIDLVAPHVPLAHTS